MHTDLSISLLNPLISLVLAMSFYLLWRYRQDRRYLAALALAYVGSSAGFLLQRFELPIGLDLTKLFSIIIFTLATICMASAVVARFGRRIPLAAFVTLGSCGVAAFAWFMFVEPSLTWRIYMLNFAFGGICLIVAAEIRVIASKGQIEKLLLVLSTLTGLNFLLRPLIAIAIGGDYQSYEGMQSSLYWTSTVLSHALLSLLIALTLFAAEAQDAMRQLKAESLTDPLSGLLNRRGFEAKASMLLDSCARSNLPVALVIADLDQFKALNDKHGHAAGDRVIVEFSTRLRMAAGDRGVAGRLGGEEFAVVLPLADPGAARLLAEAVRAVFAAEAIDGLPPDVRVTASFGVAARSGDEGLSQLMSRADEALYHAKKSGRDSVRVSYQRRSEDPAGQSGLQTA